MNNKLLISKSIQLAYLSRQVPDIDNTLVDESITEAVSRIRLEDKSFGMNAEKDMVTGVLGIIQDIQSSVEQPYTKSRILADVKMVCGEDYYDYYQDIRGVLLDDTEEVDVKKKVILQDLASIQRTIREDEIRKTISMANIDLTVNKNKIGDLSEYIDDIIAKLEKYRADDEHDPAVMDDFMLEEGNQDFVDALESVTELEDDVGVWKFPWKEFNVALQGGARPGDNILLGALQHNYKSTLMRSLYLGLCKYNKPQDFQLDSEKKPVISLMIMEDPTRNVLAGLVLNILWEDALGENPEDPDIPDISTLGASDMVSTITKEVKKNGWYPHLSKVNGDEWGYKDIIRRYDKMEANGYRVYAILIDYLFMANAKLGTLYDTVGSDVRSLLRKIRGYGASKNALTITPSQLNPEVKKMVTRGDVTNEGLLAKIAHGGYFSGSSKLSEESEIVFYINKVRGGDDLYLEVLIEKHRFYKALDRSSLKHFYLKFPDHGLPIPFDIDGTRGVGKYVLSNGVSYNNF
jgi:hypothetical protein